MTLANNRYQLVTIGVSWGGLDALTELLGALPGDLAAPVVIAQHRSAEGDSGRLPELLGSRTELHVVDAADKQQLLPGWVYLAPPDYHLLVEAGGTLALSTSARVQFARPSVDILFESAADAYGQSLVAVVLTGANADGANGVRHVKRRGGVTVAQDPEGATRREMPDAAIATGQVDRVLALDRIGPFLAAVCGTRPSVGRTGS